VIWGIPSGNILLVKPTALDITFRAEGFFTQSGSASLTDSGNLFGIEDFFAVFVTFTLFILPANEKLAAI